jgi:hypothetical protein
MRQIIKNIATILVVSLLVIATGGLNIYHHICHCEGESSASLFAATTCQHQQEAKAASCCKTVEVPDCCKGKQAPAQKHHCNGHDCCQTTSQYLKISDSFQPGLAKVSLKPLVLPSPIIYIDLPTEEYSSPALTLFNADQPPPDTGKQIVVALHQLKLDPYLV